MSEHNLYMLTYEENVKNTKEMCKSCIHKSYCMASYKKDHWCGNHEEQKNFIRSCVRV